MKITVNDITLSSDFLSIPAQGSANIPIEIENLSEKYIDYALVPCVGWLENGVVVSTTRAVTSVDEKKIFTLPAESFKNAGAIYISIGLIKDDIKIKTNEIVLYVGEAPDADVELPTDGTWETAVSSLVSSLFNERFENDINRILEEAQTLNQETKSLQQQINTAIEYLGQYEWNGTQIRFRLADGSWGPYKDIAGDFVTNIVLENYCPHRIGDIYITTNKTNPSEIWPNTEWEPIEGETLAGYKQGDENFGDLGASIGEVEHTLTIDEMPEHNHAQYVTAKASVSTGVRVDYNEDGPSAAYEQGINTGYAGNGQPHNNIQPTRVVMIWIRTA